MPAPRRTIYSKKGKIVIAGAAVLATLAVVNTLAHLSAGTIVTVSFVSPVEIETHQQLACTVIGSDWLDDSYRVLAECRMSEGAIQIPATAVIDLTADAPVPYVAPLETPIAYP